MKPAGRRGVFPDESAQEEPMRKTILMLIGLASVFAGGVACFGLFGSSEPSEGTAIEACAGLSGAAKADCERRHGG